MLNSLLDDFAKICIKYANESLDNPALSLPGLKERLEARRYGEDKTTKKSEPKKTTLFELIDRFIAGEIGNKTKAETTLKNYSSVKKHLLAFQKAKNYPINFDSITLDFLYQFTAFLRKLKLKPNTVAKSVTILKVFMGEGVDMKLHNNLEYYRHKKFTAPEEVTHAVYLSGEEIKRLYKFKFATETTRAGERPFYNRLSYRIAV